jgi:diadenosine tetraphosphate (Ap4A) HIT family hydrolase
VNRSDGLLAIEDIAPKAPVHLLVFPERHIPSFREVGELADEESSALLRFVADTASAAGLQDYRVIVNVGRGAGQTVFHLHWHILGGRELPFP